MMRNPKTASDNCVSSLQVFLARAGINSNSEPARRLGRYVALLQKWNARMNLTASTEWKRIGPLLEEAVWAASLYRRETGKHLDIGSGAGFPAIPLRILIPGIRLDLVESRTKRCMFLEAVVRELELDSVHVINDRLEAWLAWNQGPWDCISWKGVRLGARDLRLLADRALDSTCFWMFHGKRDAVEEGTKLEEWLILEQRHSCPAREGWYLSEYRRKAGARGQRPGTRDLGLGPGIKS
ncbi:MAG TPA: RsmG family class I SAM-dependent methyltransferase [Acidobacteriota bacterium]|nr:RsmG family class I SAM-dependent methyltransferase [Acidobacteriota bacterium]